MLVRIVNRWINKGTTYVPGDLVEMDPELFNHVFEVSVAEEVKSPKLIKVYNALINGKNIADNVKKLINLREDDSKWYFQLDFIIDDQNKRFHYQVAKSTEVRSAQ